LAGVRGEKHRVVNTQSSGAILIENTANENVRRASIVYEYTTFKENVCPLEPSIGSYCTYSYTHKLRSN